MKCGWIFGLGTAADGVGFRIGWIDFDRWDCDNEPNETFSGPFQLTEDFKTGVDLFARFALEQRRGPYERHTCACFRS